MKPHRIFIAINLPESIKTQLLEYKNKWPELPAKWTNAENLHLTLAFLGNTSGQELIEICELMKQISLRPFILNINQIVYGPKPNSPRMIWALLEKSPELLKLQRSIEKNLGQRSDKTFSPHLTLARIKTFELQRMETEEPPQIDENISLSFAVESVEVMESELKRSGAAYTICQSIPL